MTERQPIVYVIDDDASIRETLSSLIRSVGLRVQLFGSGKEFLESSRPDTESCLILDIRLRGMSGLDFQRKLGDSGIAIPIIFITGHGDIRMSVRAMKAGAIEFLTKPFRDQELLDAIHVALEKDGENRQRSAEVAQLESRLASLTPRERQVLPLVVSGLPNKLIAAELRISEAVTKVHRSQLMRKMRADSLPDLVRLAGKIGFPARSNPEN
ncbi:MAG TPA: response regulator transcription factor [Verrucomicrobiae bacterium]|nr:response regulator transcription factor [Verrucomicrobiae bacterium]